MDFNDTLCPVRWSGRYARRTVWQRTNSTTRRTECFWFYVSLDARRNIVVSAWNLSGVPALK